MFCLIFILFFFFFSSRRRHTRCSRDWSSDVCSSDLVGGRWSNELITSYERLRDDCVPNATFPRIGVRADVGQLFAGPNFTCADRKSTRLNSSHGYISYAVFCLKKKKTNYSVLPDKTLSKYTL